MLLPRNVWALICYLYRPLSPIHFLPQASTDLHICGWAAATGCCTGSCPLTLRVLSVLPRHYWIPQGDALFLERRLTYLLTRAEGQPKCCGLRFTTKTNVLVPHLCWGCERHGAVSLPTAYSINIQCMLDCIYLSHNHGLSLCILHVWTCRSSATMWSGNILLKRSKSSLEMDDKKHDYCRKRFMVHCDCVFAIPSWHRTWRHTHLKSGYE